MEIKHKYGDYLAPEVKVIEIKSQGVLCASGGSEQYTTDPWNPYA